VRGFLRALSFWMTLLVSLYVLSLFLGWGVDPSVYLIWVGLGMGVIHLIWFLDPGGGGRDFALTTVGFSLFIIGKCVEERIWVFQNL
jgi:hypothetical protein